MPRTPRLEPRPARRQRRGRRHEWPAPLSARRRPLARRADRGAGAGRSTQTRPLRRAPAGRAAHRGARLRQALDPDPGLLRRRGRRAGRVPARARGAGQPARARRADRGHHPGARPPVRGDRVAHLRPGAHRGDGLGQPGAGGQRADRSLPPLPAARRPDDGPRAPRQAGRADLDLPRRRRQQHGALLPARRDRCRPTRADRLPAGV